MPLSAPSPPVSAGQVEEPLLISLTIVVVSGVGHGVGVLATAGNGVLLVPWDKFKQ